VVLNLLVIGLGTTLVPVPLTAFVLVLGAMKGTWKGLAFILGWLACLVAVIAAVILATGNNPPKPQTVPSTAALAAKLAIGVALILLAGRERRQMGRARKPPAWMARADGLSLWAIAALAAFLQPWTLVAAGAATVVEAKLSDPGSFLALIAFCLLATSSFLCLEVYAVFMPARAAARLNRLRTWLESHQDQVIIVICLLLGFWLAGNSIYLLISY
jgi:threonine/homoserine/homoserine lactone efflux protein